MQGRRSIWGNLKVGMRRLRRLTVQASVVIAVCVLSGYLPHEQAMACAVGHNCGGPPPPPPPSCPSLPSPGTWIVLNNDYTRDTPAAAVFDGNVYLAWTGTNASHSVIVANSCDGLHFGTPVVYGTNTSFSGPGLAAFNGYLWLAWSTTGYRTNSNGTITDIDLAHSSDGLHFQDKFLIGTQQEFDSYTGPALAAANGQLYIAWAGSGSDVYHMLHIASSVDGLNFSDPQIYGLPLWDNANDAGRWPGIVCNSVSGGPCTVNEPWVGISYSNGQFNPTAGGNWWGFIKSLIFGTPSVSIDSPTLAVEPGSTLLWGGTGLSPTSQFDAIYVNGAPLISLLPGETSTTGIGLTTLGNTLFVAWVPRGSNDIQIYEYQINNGNYTLIKKVNTGHPCEGNPTLLTFNGHVYMYWMATNAQNSLIAEFVQ